MPMGHPMHTPAAVYCPGGQRLEQAVMEPSLYTPDAQSRHTVDVPSTKYWLVLQHTLLDKEVHRFTEGDPHVPVQEEHTEEAAAAQVPAEHRLHEVPAPSTE